METQCRMTTCHMSSHAPAAAPMKSTSSCGSLWHTVLHDPGNCEHEWMLCHAYSPAPPTQQDYSRSPPRSLPAVNEPRSSQARRQQRWTRSTSSVPSPSDLDYVGESDPPGLEGQCDNQNLQTCVHFCQRNGLPRHHWADHFETREEWLQSRHNASTMADKLPQEDPSWPQSVESREDASHRALHNQDALLGVALLCNIHKRNSFSPKRAIGNSN